MGQDIDRPRHRDNGRQGRGEPYVRLGSATLDEGPAEMRDADCIDLCVV